MNIGDWEAAKSENRNWDKSGSWCWEAAKNKI